MHWRQQRQRLEALRPQQARQSRRVQPSRVARNACRERNAFFLERFCYLFLSFSFFEKKDKKKKNDKEGIRRFFFRLSFFFLSNLDHVSLSIFPFFSSAKERIAGVYTHINDGNKYKMQIHFPIFIHLGTPALPRPLQLASSAAADAPAPPPPPPPTAGPFPL